VGGAVSRQKGAGIKSNDRKYEKAGLNMKGNGK
jgi:hypothetical protein